MTNTKDWLEVDGKLLRMRLTEDTDAPDPTADQDGIGEFVRCEDTAPVIGVGVRKASNGTYHLAYYVTEDQDTPHWFNDSYYWIPDEYCLDSISATQSLKDMAGQACDTYNQWACGDVWGAIVEDITDIDRPVHLDSCWGFYGLEYARNEGLTMLEAFNKEEVAA